MRSGRGVQTVALVAIGVLTATAACSDADDASSAARADTTAVGESTTAVTTATVTTATTATATTAAATTTVTTARADGGTTSCGSDAAGEGVSVVEITSGGLDREYRLYVPPVHDGTARLPVVLDFHGLGSNAEQQAALSNLEGLAGVEGFVAVHPQGTADPRTGSSFFELGFGGSGVDDVGFTADVLDHLEATLCVDGDRVYATGFSNGGYMSSRLACDLSERIVAIAPVAATYRPDDCAPSHQVPVLAFHGTDDVVVPYAGGDSVLSGESTPGSIAELLAQHIPDEIAEWAAANGCAGANETQVSAEVVLTTHQDCDAAVGLYTVDGGGHTWPGSLVGRTISSLGHTTTDIDATALAWEFFQQQSR